MDAIDITHLFSLDEVDHHELLALFDIRWRTCWQISDDEIAFPAQDEHALAVRMAHGEIEAIAAGPLLTDEVLADIVQQVGADLKDEGIAEYGREILFAHQPVMGGHRFTSVPMQISPAPPEAPRPSAHGAQHPFVLEYPIRRYRTGELRLKRRYKNLVEWAWALNAFLVGSISYRGPRPRHMWAVASSDPNFECHWANELYTVAGFEGIAPGLSQLGATLQVVPASVYFGNWARRARELPLDTFVVPDNLDALTGAFLKLKGATRRRFLRSAAALHYARQLFDTSISSSFLSCAQAIETLIDWPSGPQCPQCKRSTAPGPTKVFLQTLEQYRGEVEVDAAVLKGLYRVRSALAHGNYLFQLDEAPWSFGIASSVSSLNEQESIDAAMTLSKSVLRNWLLAQVHQSTTG